MNTPLAQWVDEMSQLCQPDAIHWCDGSETEHASLTQQAVDNGELIPLHAQKFPGCYYHRSAENDVARMEKLTYICTRSKTEAGPTNHWMDPQEAYSKLGAIFKGSMKGRTMYVVPFLMGPPGSTHSKVGVQLTDSLYVVLSMRIMTRMGRVALDQLAETDQFTRCLHGKADLAMDHRFICHFPEDNTVWSVGSNYGGNALLGKKCLALRIGSFLGKRQGWLAEHMLIVGIENPKGEIHYIAAAFPSSCGKTNLSMLVPPASMKGYRVWTVGDDIAWLRPGPDGRLWAVNPEAGLFGVAPGTSHKTNPNAMETIRRNTIFTNVVLADDKTVWWEGLDNPPAHGTDWRGQPWTPTSPTNGAHPNSRFTAPIMQCPTASPEWNNPQGVPISAIVFGARHAKVAPLVQESFDWAHGVYLGATMASETTSAADGQVGVLRRDPMAMLPFCGYHMGDYFAHWLKMGLELPKPPKIFHVNWFRTDDAGKYLWPGFGENLRVVLWMIERCHGRGEAFKTPIGHLPATGSVSLEGLSVSKAVWDELMRLDKDEWIAELDSQKAFFEKFGERFPKTLWDEWEATHRRFV